MDEKVYVLFGVAAPLLACTSIGASIMLSPWFSWQMNALSDLGHSVRSDVAPIFNFGLISAAFLMMIYAFNVLTKHARYTGVFVVVSAFMLQLVATFDEVYGFLHLTVSVLFFISIGITSIVYAIEKKSPLAVIAFMIGLGSWIIYGLKIYNIGIAVPETISSIAIMLLLIYSALKTYISK